jgi:hypothetical protein
VFVGIGEGMDVSNVEIDIVGKLVLRLIEVEFLGRKFH